MFDVPPPLQSRGLDEYRKTWDLFFSCYRPSHAFDIDEIAITAGDDVAFAVDGDALRPARRHLPVQADDRIAQGRRRMAHHRMSTIRCRQRIRSRPPSGSARATTGRPQRVRTSSPIQECSTMLTVYGEGRGFRVVWLLEELGLAYRLRPVDLFAVEHDRDFLAINPAGFIPVLQDGETIMVESVAILQYLLARHGSGFTCRRTGRSRLRVLSAISPSGRGRARRADERRHCRSQFGARSRARRPRHPLGTRDLREPAGLW